jgi:hypothetical protein
MPGHRLMTAVAVIAAAWLPLACGSGAHGGGQGGAGQNGSTATASTPTASGGTGSGGTGSGGTGGSGSGGTGSGGSGGTGTVMPTQTALPTDSPTTSPAPSDTRPVVGNIVASPQNVECSYVPNGNLDGSDELTVFAYILLIGANNLPGPLTTSMVMSNGFTASWTGGPSNNAAIAFTGTIYSGDWGGSLTVHLVTDPNDVYRETSEADNAIDVTVSLPAARPSQTIDPLPCTARQA